MAVWLVLCALLSVSQCQGVTEVPVSVTRRGEGDRVSLSSSGSSSCVIRDCPPLNSSYLVEEMQCVQDTMLQNNCSVQLVPVLPEPIFTTTSISAFIADNGSLMVLDPVSNTYGVGRLHGNTDRNRQGSGGECSISGLFVVRGERDVIPLNQSGFDVVVYRDIQIRVDRGGLAYDIEDYNGEIYRVDLTCVNQLVDCVFFKLNGTTDLTEEKFNGHLTPRQLDRDSCFEAPPTITPTDTPTDTPTTTPPPPTTSTDSGLLSNTTFRYVLIGIGTGLGVLLCITCVLCVVLCCLLVQLALKRTRRPTLVSTSYTRTDGVQHGLMENGDYHQPPVASVAGDKRQQLHPSQDSTSSVNMLNPVYESLRKLRSRPNPRGMGEEGMEMRKMAPSSGWMGEEGPGTRMAPRSGPPVRGEGKEGLERETALGRGPTTWDVGEEGLGTRMMAPGSEFEPPTSGECLGTRMALHNVPPMWREGEESLEMETALGRGQIMWGEGGEDLVVIDNGPPMWREGGEGLETRTLDSGYRPGKWREGEEWLEMGMAPGTEERVAERETFTDYRDAAFENLL